MRLRIAASTPFKATIFSSIDVLSRGVRHAPQAYRRDQAVVHLTQASSAPPAFGRIALWQFRPGMLDAVSPQVNGDRCPRFGASRGSCATSCSGRGRTAPSPPPGSRPRSRGVRRSGESSTAPLASARRPQCERVEHREQRPQKQQRADANHTVTGQTRTRATCTALLYSLDGQRFGRYTGTIKPTPKDTGTGTLSE